MPTQVQLSPSAINDIAASAIVRLVFTASAPPSLDDAQKAVAAAFLEAGCEPRGWLPSTVAKALEVASHCRLVTSSGKELSNPTVRGAMAEAGVGPGATITFSAVVKAAILYLRDQMKQATGGVHEPERMDDPTPDAADDVAGEEGGSAESPHDAEPGRGVMSTREHEYLTSQLTARYNELLEHSTKASSERIQDLRESHARELAALAAARRTSIRSAIIVAAALTLIIGVGGGLLLISRQFDARLQGEKAQYDQRITEERSRLKADLEARLAYDRERSAQEISRLMRVVSPGAATTAPTP